jgi:protein involved in polysaccharide export with SLBB domain/beta-lactamase regulating signal transducer with metallopeptidase domain
MTQLFLEFTVRAALMAAATAAVLSVMQVRTAAARHRVWAGFVFVMLFLPLWLTWGPRANLRVLPNVSKPAAGMAGAPKMLVDPTLPSQMEPYISAIRPAPRGPRLLLGLYLLGVFVLLARLTIGTVRARRLARRAVNRDGRLTSSSCASPVTVGWIHPVVILPENWTQWPAAQMEAVWAHEREHARRRDPLVQWLAVFNRAVFWFHPVAWWLERKLSALAEEACDTAVLESGHDPREYSQCLLDMARSVMRQGFRIDVEGMAMPGSFLPQRIRRILAGARAPRISRTRMACASATCAVLSAALAAGTLTYRPQQPKAAATSTSGSAPRPAPSVAPAPPSVARTRPHVLLAQTQSGQAGQAPLPKTPPDTRRLYYTLGTGDQVLVRVPEAEAIDNRPFRLDADGNINVPMLGPVHAGGMKLRELEADLVERLRRDVSDPHVTVTVLQFRARPVFLVGMFARPGVYPLEGDMTLLQVVMAAGGPLPDAGPNIKITRHAEYGSGNTIEISVKSLLDNVNPAEDILLQPFDEIVIGPR